MVRCEALYHVLLTISQIERIPSLLHINFACLHLTMYVLCDAHHIKMHTAFKIDYVQFVMLNRVETMIVTFFLLLFTDLCFKITYQRVMWKIVKSMHLINV